MSLIKIMMWCGNVKKKFTLQQDGTPAHTSKPVEQQREENPKFH